MNEKRIVDIAESRICDEDLANYAFAYDLRLALNHLNKKVDTATKARIACLGIYAWLKSQNNYSTSSYFDAICSLLNTEKYTIANLEELDKFALLEILEEQFV